MCSCFKAISPGENLRTYLETKSSLNIESLLEILRSHFHEKDSSSVFTELCNAVQDSNENAHDFVIRMLCLRQKVLTLAHEEGAPYEVAMVQKRLLHTIETGLKNNNIRSELLELSVLDKYKKLSDEQLLKAVSEAMANENERIGKLAKNREQNSAVLNVEDKSIHVEAKRKKDCSFQIQIQELRTKQEKESAALRSNI